jgi:hypothetical protein
MKVRLVFLQLIFGKFKVYLLTPSTKSLGLSKFLFAGKINTILIVIRNINMLENG